MTVRENLKAVQDRISAAAGRAGRDPADITIVAVTKMFGPEVVIEVLEAGIENIGENRMQEFLVKAEAVTLPCRWHLVGHLQTNKVAKAVGRFALIHSVDSLRLAGRLSRVSEERGIVTDILLEVNTSGEESKYGLEPAEMMDACGNISGLAGVQVRGLMTVGPWVTDKGAVSASFERLARLRQDVTESGIERISMEHLSMGMTDDFETAIELGSTIVRLGRVLFGERDYG